MGKVLRWIQEQYMQKKLLFYANHRWSWTPISLYKEESMKVSLTVSGLVNKTVKVCGYKKHSYQGKL